MDIKQLHDFVDEISTHIVSIEHLVQKNTGRWWALITAEEADALQPLVLIRQRPIARGIMADAAFAVT